jgi:hypothetical protein
LDDDEYDLFLAETDAKIQVISEELLRDMCPSPVAPDATPQPWPERCSRELSYRLRSSRKMSRVYESVCQEEAPEDTANRVAEGIANHEDGPLYFGMLLPCYEKLSEVAALEKPQQTLELRTVAMQSIDAMCQRTGSEKPLEMVCETAPSKSIERCANTLLRMFSTEPTIRKAIKHVCPEGQDFLSNGTTSGRTKLQDTILYMAAFDRQPLQRSGALAACKITDKEALLASVDAAYKCMCPTMRRSLPPLPEEGSEHNRAELWSRLTGAAVDDVRHDVENVLATAAAERPHGLQDILELALYPKYEQGPLAHLRWPLHHDFRFSGDVAHSNTDFLANKAKAPKVVRVFRFATHDRLGNGNAGDLAHVCAWGRGAAAQDNVPAYMLDPGYALFVYSVKTGERRTGYSKCNAHDCGEGVDGLGWRFKDLGAEGGCYKGNSAWLSLPTAGEGKSWSKLSLDRVVRWRCVVEQGVYAKGYSTEKRFQELDKILFSLEGCFACPDLYAPDSSPRRVCPEPSGAD